MNKTVVFVHGWSVTNLNTYGNLPVRLAKEAEKAGTILKVKEIFLGRYVSFSDEVRLQDISAAFEHALQDSLAIGEQFICITHSTGGPVVRDWLHRFNGQRKTLTHLIMLAPANFGSALAQLGKSRVSRLKNWFGGLEPGQRVLDWLELGSEDAWNLNLEWMRNGHIEMGTQQYYPFVVTGQSIDRKLYDNLNSYTGELGSDGVVRVSAANLNARYVKLVQEVTRTADGAAIITDKLINTEYVESTPVPLRIVSGKSHSGKEMGIMASVRSDGDDENVELIGVLLDCIAVDSSESFEAVRLKFEEETMLVQQKEKVEIEEELLIMKRYFIHDRFSQIIFKIKDSEGRAVTDYDLLFTAGDANSPNHLPEGFAPDRQQNRLHRETVTYYFNYDIITGCAQIKSGRKVIRGDCSPIDKLGLIIHPRPESGFVRYSDCHLVANTDLLRKVLHPNSTTMIEIELQRIVSSEVFRLEKLAGNKMPSDKKGNFKDIPGTDIIN